MVPGFSTQALVHEKEVAGNTYIRDKNNDPMRVIYVFFLFFRRSAVLVH